MLNYYHVLQESIGHCNKLNANKIKTNLSLKPDLFTEFSLP